MVRFYTPSNPRIVKIPNDLGRVLLPEGNVRDF